MDNCKPSVQAGLPNDCFIAYLVPGTCPGMMHKHLRRQELNQLAQGRGINKARTR